MDTGVTTTRGITNYCEQYILHPSSSIPVMGFKIPFFEPAKKVVTEAAKLAYEEIGARWVGWDVTILENGVALIEGNPHQGNHLIQLDHGIWRRVSK